MLGDLFQSDPDLRLTGSEIYLDAQEPRKIGIISHGHGDHIGRHEHFIATPPTAAFLRLRSGDDLRGTELPYRTSHHVDGFQIALYPAGHILGSAMVRVESERGSLVYTGDFKLTESHTAERAEIPHGDAVIMESTYGSPEWVFPSRDAVRGQLIETVKGILARGRTAVLLAYSLGKAQETMAMLRGESIPVVVHTAVASISAIYERQGIDLGRYEVWGAQSSFFARTTRDLRAKAVIIPPHMSSDIRRVPRRETVALTGWALHPYRSLGADHGIPLSDHAGFDDLVRFAENCGAKTIYVTHGSKRFADELRKRGIRAEFLRRKPQMRLF
jgi:putative mRNA 3-end processing factor